MWEEYSEILDNKEFTVESRANWLAQGADSVKIAVGYYFVGGFELLADNLEEADAIQLLIGHQTSANTIEQLKNALYEDLEDFDPEETRDGVKKLYKLSQLDQIEVRVFTDEQERFHPKLYLYRYPDDDPHFKSLGRAIVGSSNLSTKGLSGNIELNVEKADSDSIRYLDGWFDDLWDEAEPFSPLLMKEIFRASQFRDAIKEADEEIEGEGERPQLADVEVISPHEATKRFIAEQFPREIDEGTLLDDITGEYEEQLTAFQQDAVRAARQPLEKYNGVILSDSVGLGKSFIGAPLVQESTTEQDNVLVIGPNRLEDMWMREMFGVYESFEDPYFELRASATYISFNKLSILSEEEIQRFRSYDFVLIDEAHKLRNQRTKRYGKLQAIGRQGKKFVCLTATPVQNSARDVDNIIKIFADDSDFDIELVDHPSNIFREYDRLSSIPDSDRTKPEQQRLGTLQSQIEKIMREVVIARDRKFIIDTYGNDISVDGRPISVPERNPSKVTPNDPGLEDLYHELVTVVAGALDDEDDTGLNLPYLVAQRYDRDKDEEEELILEYQSTSFLLAINLLKRLESSIAAFNESITTLIEREKATRTIAAGDFTNSQDRDQAIEYLEDTLQNFEGDVEINEVVEAVEATNEGQRKQLIDDIDEDLEKLRALKDRAEAVLSGDSSTNAITGGNRDSKADTLREKIQRELAGEKVIVFSQFIPTIEHLFEELTGENPSNTQVASLEGNEAIRVAYVHGDAFKDSIIDRFAPQGRKPEQAITADEEIDILLSTDILSEGQNLQDARNLVNYDLHWNPMRMEQRIGRIDRITTRHDALYIYNFVPIGDLRKHLGLLKRLETKIKRVADSIGHSAPIIDSAEERVQKSFTIYDSLEDAEFGDTEFEGIGSKYDELRRAIRRFCEEANLTIEELQRTKAETMGLGLTQFFVNHDADTEAFMGLVRLWHSTGRSEWRATLFNKTGLSTVTLGDQTKFQEHPRIGADEVEVFRTIASEDDTRHELPNNETEIRRFATDIDSVETWSAEIFAEESAPSPTITKLKKFCRRVAEDESYGDETTSKAEQIIRELTCESVPGAENMEMSDYAVNELEQIYRKRTRYGYQGVINRIYQKLTQEIELVPPERVTSADLVIFGDIA